MSFHVIQAEWKSITNYGKILSFKYTKYGGYIYIYSALKTKKEGGVH
jgi:hypothetical protein